MKGKLNNLIELVKKGLIFLLQAVAGFSILVLAGVCIYFPFLYLWKIVTHQFDTRTTMIILLSFIAVNLLVYQLIAVVIAHLWNKRNKDYRLLNTPPEMKRELMKIQGVSSEDELKLGRPSLIGAIFIHSSFALQMIEDNLIDGPHMRRDAGEKVNGIFTSRRFFEFAVFKGELYNHRFFARMFQPRYIPYVIMTGVLMYLSLVLWCLIPFRIAMHKHFIKVNQFVIQFSDITVFRLKNWGIDCSEDLIGLVRELQELRKEDIKASN